MGLLLCPCFPSARVMKRVQPAQRPRPQAAAPTILQLGGLGAETTSLVDDKRSHEAVMSSDSTSSLPASVLGSPSASIDSHDPRSRVAASVQPPSPSGPPPIRKGKIPTRPPGRPSRPSARRATTHSEIEDPGRVPSTADPGSDVLREQAATSSAAKPRGRRAQPLKGAGLLAPGEAWTTSCDDFVRNIKPSRQALNKLPSGLLAEGLAGTAQESEGRAEGGGMRAAALLEVVFGQMGALGIKFHCKTTAAPAMIKSIVPGGMAARDARLRSGLVLVAVQDESVVGQPFAAAMAVLTGATRPLRLIFADRSVKAPSNDAALMVQPSPHATPCVTCPGQAAGKGKESKQDDVLRCEGTLSPRTFFDSAEAPGTMAGATAWDIASTSWQHQADAALKGRHGGAMPVAELRA